MSQHGKGTSEETLAWTSDSTESPVKDLTGTMLGDFEVKRLLGRGGMGQVYLARQISLDRPVAIKVLHPRFLSKPAYLSRFEAEATAVAKLNHPNIVHVYTLGCVDQVRFIAMEYVEGTNLRDYIEKKGALDLPLALSIMRQSGQAIGVAGEVGLIHRDIKPDNLLLTRRGRVKVADFGLCRDLGAERMNITQPGITVGTPLYMSPEQAQGRVLDHRSDLYSLGVTFYHMLTGVPPFRADSAVALALKHVNEIPVSLRVHRMEVPPELDRLVLKLMAKNPADRYQSAAEMLADLARVRGSLQAAGGLGPDDPAAAISRSEEARALTPTEPAAKPPSFAFALPVEPVRSLATRRNLALAAGIFLLAGAALGWNSRPDGRPGGEEGSRPAPGMSLDPRWRRSPQAGNRRATVPFCPAPRTGRRPDGRLARGAGLSSPVSGMGVPDLPAALALALSPEGSRSPHRALRGPLVVVRGEDAGQEPRRDPQVGDQAAEQGSRRRRRGDGGGGRPGRQHEVRARAPRIQHRDHLRRHPVGLAAGCPGAQEGPGGDPAPAGQGVASDPVVGMGRALRVRWVLRIVPRCRVGFRSRRPWLC